MSGRCGRHENQIDFARLDLGLLDRLQRRFRRHVAGRFIFGGHAALFDAGACRDPLVARVDHAREIVIGQNFLRHVTAGAND